MTKEKSETLQKMILAYLVHENADDENIIQFMFNELAEFLSGSPAMARPYWIFALETTAKLMRKEDKDSSFLADLLKMANINSVQMATVSYPDFIGNGGQKDG